MLQSNRVRLGVVLVVIFTLVFIDRSPGYADSGVVDVGTSIFRADVFVNNDGTLINPTAVTPANTGLFNVAGAPLNVSWVQWQRAAAVAEAFTYGDPKHAHTEVRIRLHGLIPGGLYSIYYATFGPDTINPYCPNVEHLLPLTIFNPGPASPGSASFVPDKSGRAEYRARLDHDLLSASRVIYTVIYHYDGHAYDPLPNRGESLTQGSSCRSSFGQDDGRQLLILQKG